MNSDTVLRSQAQPIWRLGVIVSLVPLTAGCQHRIVLRNLSPATPQNVPPFRQLASYAYDRAGNVNPDYALTAADEVEFRWARGTDRVDHLISIDAHCSDPDCKSCPAGGVPSSSPTVNPLIRGLHPRLPIAVLGRVNQIVVSDPEDPTMPLRTIDLCKSGQFVLDPHEDRPDLRPKWAKVTEVFSGNPPDMALALDVGLVANPSRYAFPGDLIRTTITISRSESVSYRLPNGLKCRIGPEKPPLVHNAIPNTKESVIVNILKDMAGTVYGIYQCCTTLNSAFATWGVIAGLA